jgi:hypothetical protein
LQALPTLGLAAFAIPMGAPTSVKAIRDAKKGFTVGFFCLLTNTAKAKGGL